MQDIINTSPTLKACVSSFVNKRAAKTARSLRKTHLLVIAGTAMFASGTSETEARQIIPKINLDFLKPKNPLPEQWYGGTNIGYSPAFLKGEGGVEPFFIGNLPAGKFDSNGQQHKGNSIKTFVQDIWIKQAITNQFSVLVQPTWSYTSANQKSGANSAGFDDLPVDFLYRWESEYSPSLTTYMGFKAPTGRYNNLANTASSTGSGTFDLRYGMILQFIRPFFKQQMRFRIWGFGRTPVSSANLRNLTAYGTQDGFRGKAHVGSYGTEGITGEFGITRQWVVGLDLYSDWASGSRVSGKQNGKNFYSRTGWETDYNVGPAIEYSPSASLSAVFEVVVMVAGHNTTRVISPQLGIYYEW